jgi:hypothetical protein
MTRTRIVILTVAGAILLLAGLHLAVHGLPDLGSWNPHTR